MIGVNQTPRQRGTLQRADVGGRRAHLKSEKAQGMSNEATNQGSQATAHGEVMEGFPVWGGKAWKR